MPGTATKVPFADASPEELRAAILPEDQAEFDDQYRAALDAAARTLRLDEIDAFLEHWRRTAWMQTADGHDAWRRVLARAEYTLATGGDWPPQDASAEEIRALLRDHQATT